MNHNAAEESYFRWIRFAVGQSETCPSAEGVDWKRLYTFSVQQAIAGVMFEAISKSGVKIPREVLLPWFALSEQIKKRNRLLNQRCVELTELLRKDGFESCILKGQGNALTYPAPYSRTPGDIDVFVLPDGNLSISERRQLVTNYVRQRFPDTRIRYQHIDYPVFRDVEVEMHFIPTAKNHPLHNYRLQQWVELQIRNQCRNVVDLPDGIGKIAIPTVAFNVVYQLSHLMHHFFDEGIGLRQMIDYYYVLKDWENQSDLTGLLKKFGLLKFAGAVMFVMQEVLGLEDKYLTAPVDEQRGQMLLNEILRGGNFGKYSGLTQHSTGTKYFLKHWRNLHFVREYPSEALCEPVFRTWHFFWRLAH